jgi:hypothetical protein
MIGHLIKPELEELINGKRWEVLREALSHFHPSDIAEILVEIPEADDVPIFGFCPATLQGKYLPICLPTTKKRSFGRSPTSKCGHY